LFLFLSSSLQAQSSFWKQLPGPEGASVTCTAQVGTDWFIGTGSGVFKSTDQGDHWASLDWVPQTQSVVGMDMRPGEMLIATSSPDFSSFDYQYEQIFLLYRSTDEGQNWSVDTIKIDQFSSPYLSQIFRHRDYIYAVTSNAMLRSADNGHSWANATTNNIYIETVQHNDSLVLINTSFDGPYYSKDGGDSWQTLAPPPTGFFANSTILGKGYTFIVAANYENTYRSTNFGTSWQSLGTPFGNNEIAVGKVLADGNITAFVNYPNGDEMMYTSANNGQSWKKYSGSPVSMALDVIHSGSVYGVATTNGFYKNYATGNFLNPSNTGIGASNIKTMRFYGDQFLVGNSDGLWRSFDSGANWFSAFPQSQLAGTIDIEASGDTLCALTANNFYYSTDAGDSWTAPNTDAFGPFFPFDAEQLMIDGGKVVVSGEDLNLSSDFGISWSAFSDYPRSSGLINVDGTYFALAYWDGIIKSEDKGASWHLNYSNILGSGKMFYFKNTIFAATDNKLLYSKDLGQTWAPALGIPVYNQYNYSLPVHAMVANDTAIFAAVDYAGVYQSKDEGLTWTPFSTALPNPRFNDMLLKNNVLYVACTEGGIWYHELLPVATHAPAQAQSLRISPNPVRDGDVQLSWNEPSSEPMTIRVFDALGRCVLTQTTQSNEGQLRIPVAGLKAGAYRVSAYSTDKIWAGTFIRI
ncbi:MAG: T9SS type A sorting domain-containing protein, partial [Bacteroidota bacterium]